MSEDSNPNEKTMSEWLLVQTILQFVIIFIMAEFAIWIFS